MKLSWSKLAVLALTGALGGALWSGAAQAATVKIGFNVPLTGFAAADGKSALTGAQLAVEHTVAFQTFRWHAAKVGS